MKFSKLLQCRRLILLGFALAACGLVRAQATPAPAPTPAATPATRPAPAIQTGAPHAGRTVRLNVIVSDESNRFVDGLRQEDFRVEEEGVPQSITSFSTEAVPVSYGVVMDNSGSMKSLLDSLIRTAASLFLANRAGDETMLARFVDSDNIQVIEDFTTDPNAFAKGLSGMGAELGQTAVIDAVHLCVEHVARRRVEETTRRRALVLLTDGEDRVSYYRLGDLEKLLERTDVQVFVVGLVMNLDKEGGIIGKSKREKAVKLLNTLARKSGGRAFYPRNREELIAVVNEISHDLRTQYVIGYQPSKARPDGKHRNIQVKLSEHPAAGKRTVHARAVYVAPGARRVGKIDPKEKSLRLATP
jgi:Ca-activated chloride channel family protein